MITLLPALELVATASEDSPWPDIGIVSIGLSGVAALVSGLSLLILWRRRSHEAKQYKKHDGSADDVYRHAMVPVAAFLANFEIYLGHELERERGLEGVLRFIPDGIWPLIDATAYEGADKFIQDHRLARHTKLRGFGNVEGNQLREALAFLLKAAWQRGYLMYKFHRLDYIPAPNDSVEPGEIMDRVISSRGTDQSELSTSISVFLQRAVSLSTEREAIKTSLTQMPSSLYAVLEPILDDWADLLRSTYGWGILSAKAEEELEEAMEPRVQVTAGDGAIVVVSRRVEHSFNNININVAELRSSGQQDIARALSELNDAVVKSDELDDEEKAALIERLSEIARQATLPSERRQRSVVKDLLVGITSVASAAAGFAEAWSQWGDTIRQFFDV